jgi:hypothetical protein
VARGRLPIVVAITGASGAPYAVRLLECLLHAEAATRDPVADVRRAALRLLSTLDRGAAEGVARSLLDDPDAGVRTFARGLVPAPAPSPVKTEIGPPRQVPAPDVARPVPAKDVPPVKDAPPKVSDVPPRTDVPPLPPPSPSPPPGK